MIDQPITSSRAAAASEVVAEAEHAPLDLVHLARFTFGDRTLEREILELFRTQTGKSIAELDAAATDREWYMAAHTLKGSSRAVGAKVLGDIAAEVEHLNVADREACARATAALRAAESATNAYIARTFQAD